MRHAAVQTRVRGVRAVAGAEGAADEGTVLVTRGASRLTIRTLAAGMLLFGVTGAGHLGGDRDRHAAETAAAAEAEAVSAEVQMKERMAEAYERTDRSRRAAVSQAPPGADGAADHVGRAEEARTRPTEPAPAADPPAAPSVPASCGEYSGNRATGCALLQEWGFSLDHMSCLDNLWTRESNWNELAENPSSGAYGIPQALPGDKMAEYGDDWRTNPVTQIEWGLNYIENRYGTPCSAWSFFQVNNWY